MFGALGLIGFLVAIAMYFVWRLWLKLRGVEWKPQGRWEPRLKASDEYQKTLPPLTRRQQVALSVVLVLSVPAGLAGAVFVITHSK